MRHLSLTKYATRSLVQAYIHCRHSAGLLQRYILAGTADTVIKRLQSVQKTAARLVSGTIFRDHYHYLTQPHWLLVWRRIVSKSTILSTYMNSAYDRLNIFEVVSGCRHQLDNQC